MNDCLCYVWSMSRRGHGRAAAAHNADVRSMLIFAAVWLHLPHRSGNLSTNAEVLGELPRQRSVHTAAGTIIKHTQHT